MEKYAPHVMDLASRDVVSRAIITEVNEGRGFPGGYVHLELMHLGRERIESRLQEICDYCRLFAGVDPVVEPIPVMPAQHYMMGGIGTDIRGATNVACFFRRGSRVRFYPRRQSPRRQLALGNPRLRETGRNRSGRVRHHRPLPVFHETDVESETQLLRSMSDRGTARSRSTCERNSKGRWTNWSGSTVSRASSGKR